MRFSLAPARHPLSWLFIALVLATGGFSASARELTAAEWQRPIVIASDPWCPYACDPEADGREGYMVDLAREVFEGLGFKVEYRVVNFAVLRRMASDGSATAVPGAASTMDRLLMLPPLAQGNSANAVAAARSLNFTFNSPLDFAPLRLGVIKDYDYGGAIQEYVDQNIQNQDRITVLSGFGYSHLVQGLRMVAAGRLDLVMDDENVLRWHLRRLGLEHQIAAVPLNDAADLFVGFSQSDSRAPELARIMADATRDLRANGRLAAIMRHYGLMEQGPMANK